MKKQLLAFLSVLSALVAVGQGADNYTSLDKKHPVYFGGHFIVYEKDTIRLNQYHFFIDGRLSDAVTSKYPYVFNSINKAVAKLSNGTVIPMTEKNYQRMWIGFGMLKKIWET